MKKLIIRQPLALHWKIFIAIVLAIFMGSLFSKNFDIFGIKLVSIYEFFGSIFLNALKMIIVPLIMSSIIVGIANTNDASSIGRLGLKAIAFYLTTSIVAITTGLILVNTICPGIIDGIPAGPSLGLSQNVDLSGSFQDKGLSDIVEIFYRMIPSNIVAAAAEGNMLGIIFFSIMFGFFLNKINKETSQTLIKFFQGVFDTMMLFTMWVMKFLSPVGVFGLVAKTVSETGINSLKPLFMFFLTVIIGLGIHLFINMSLALRFIAKVNPLLHFKAMIPAMVTAFSSASSSATLPLTIECVEKNSGVSNRISSFILPMGATINMDGSALYECVVAIFLAQAYGIELSLINQFTIMFLALLTSIGVAGVPSASLVALVIVLNAIGLPLESLGIIMMSDRILDMCRTTVNIFSDSVGAVIIASTEGETQILKKHNYYEHM